MAQPHRCIGAVMKTLSTIEDQSLPMLASVPTYLAESKGEKAKKIVKMQREKIDTDIREMKRQLVTALGGIGAMKKRISDLEEKLEQKEKEDLNFSDCVEAVEKSQLASTQVDMFNNGGDEVKSGGHVEEEEVDEKKEVDQMN